MEIDKEKSKKYYYKYNDKETSLLKPNDLILVSSGDVNDWEERHFSYCSESTGSIFCYVDGLSYDETVDVAPWDIWKPISQISTEITETTETTEITETTRVEKIEKDKKYMVYIKNQNGPKVVHNSLEDADKELDRLLLKCKNSGEVGYIFELVKTKITKIVVEEQEI